MLISTTKKAISPYSLYCGISDLPKVFGNNKKSFPKWEYSKRIHMGKWEIWNVSRNFHSIFAYGLISPFTIAPGPIKTLLPIIVPTSTAEFIPV